MIGIPAHNESQSIAEVVTGARRYTDTVLVVDNGSSDDTAKCGESAGATVIRHETNRGYGQTLKTIF
jgi:glycosyltransferase involved in cell wall biosynthesis